MSHILKCPKCQKTYSVNDQSELAGKNYCVDCKVELKPVQPTKSAVVPAMISAINIADAPAEVQAAFKAKPLQIANKYIIVRKLGQGGMGAVYQGWDINLKRYVALKVILPSADDPSMKEDSIKRFIREAQTAAKLTHPNILQVYEVGKYQNNYFIAMEYVDGGTLDSYWSNKHQPSSQTGRQRGLSSLKRPALRDIKEYLHIMRRVSEGIDYAHSQGIIHRDIKPENVLLHIDKSGKTVPKVADFGLAKDVASNRKLTMAGTVVGTPLYMSPEQATAGKLDTRSDIFSLGSVLYKLCTGTEPFQGKSSLDVMKAVVNKEPILPSRLNRAIDRDLDVLILKTMEKEKERRYQTSRELGEDIERYLKGETIKARPASFVYKISRRVKRNKLAFAGIGAGVVLLIILISVLISSGKQSAEQHQTAQEYLTQADRLYKAKDWLKAKEFYNKYLTLVKTDKDAQDKLIDAEKNITDKEKLEKQAQDEAQNAWLYAAQIFPEFYKPKADMDRVWKQIDKAIGMLDESLKKKPNPFGYFYRGMLNREKGDLDKAIIDFTKAIEQDKEFTMGWIMRGTVYFEQYVTLLFFASAGKAGEQTTVSEELTEKARADFDRSEEIKSDKYTIITEQFKKYIKLFEALIWRGKDNQRCIKLLEEGYKEYLAEEFPYWLGMMADSSKNIEAAEKYLKGALEIKPQYVEVFSSLGYIKGDQEDWDGSIALYDTAIKIRPNFTEAYNNRGWAKYAKGDLDGAIADYSSAIKLDPNFAFAYSNRGDAKRKKGDLDGAMADYNTAIKITPNLARFYSIRGNAKKAKGDLDGAMADYNTAIKLNPNDTEAYNNRGITKSKKGDLEGALADYNTAIRLNPNDAEAYNNLGFAKSDKAERERSPAIQLELLDGAIAYYSSAIKINPNFAVAYINRGVARQSKGDLKGALADFETALKLNPAYKDKLGPVMEDIKRKLKESKSQRDYQ